MKLLVKGNKVLAAILSFVAIMGAAIPVNAASADVNIEVKATTMDNVSVTVPTTLPIVFNEDGTNTLPSNWTIENISSIAGVHLSAVDMNANSSGHQGGAFNKNFLFGRVRIAYKDDHNHRVFMSFSPYKQTSGDKAIILGEVRTENYPLIGRVAGGGTSWFNQIIKANAYIQQIKNGAGTVTTVGKVGYYNGNQS